MPRDYEDFRLGVRVFSDVRITISSDREEDEEWKNGKLAALPSINILPCTLAFLIVVWNINVLNLNSRNL